MQSEPISEDTAAGTLRLKLQSTTGAELTTQIEVMLSRKPERREKAQLPEVEVKIMLVGCTHLYALHFESELSR